MSKKIIVIGSGSHVSELIKALVKEEKIKVQKNIGERIFIENLDRNTFDDFCKKENENFVKFSNSKPYGKKYRNQPFKY